MAPALVDTSRRSSRRRSSRRAGSSPAARQHLRRRCGAGAASGTGTSLASGRRKLRLPVSVSDAVRAAATRRGRVESANCPAANWRGWCLRSIPRLCFQRSAAPGQGSKLEVAVTTGLPWWRDGAVRRPLHAPTKQKTLPDCGTALGVSVTLVAAPRWPAGALGDPLVTEQLIPTGGRRCPISVPAPSVSVVVEVAWKFAAMVPTSRSTSAPRSPAEDRNRPWQYRLHQSFERRPSRSRLLLSARSHRHSTGLPALLVTRTEGGVFTVTPGRRLQSPATIVMWMGRCTPRHRHQRVITPRCTPTD
jgi:hypothetical protein